MEKLYSLLKVNKLLVLLILAVIALSSLYVNQAVELSKVETSLNKVKKEKADLFDRLELERTVAQKNSANEEVINDKFGKIKRTLRDKFPSIKAMSSMENYSQQMFKLPVIINLGTPEEEEEDEEPIPEVGLSPDAIIARDILCGAGLAEDSLCNNP